jgi:hypothetical protein
MSDKPAHAPEHVMEATTPAMTAMHRALERRDYAEALALLKVWAGLLGVETARPSGSH